MVADADEIVIGANGKVWVADTDATMPTDVGTALSGDWVDLGYVSEDGVTLGDAKDVGQVPVWQSRYPARRLIESRDFTAAFVLRQWNENTLPFALGGGAVTGGDLGVNEIVSVALTDFSGTDSFKVTFGGAESAIITRGTNYTAAGIKAAIEGIAGFSFGVTVTAVSDSGFTLEFIGDYADTNVGAVTITSGVGVSGIATVVQSGSATGGTEFVYTPPAPEDIDERALVVEWQDGDKDYRLLIEKGMVTESVETQLVRNSAADLPITFGATPTDGTDPYLIFTNDPAFVS